MISIEPTNAVVDGSGTPLLGVMAADPEDAAR